jgi:hypothetical protein
MIRRSAGYSELILSVASPSTLTNAAVETNAARCSYRILKLYRLDAHRRKSEPCLSFRGPMAPAISDNPAEKDLPLSKSAALSPQQRMSLRPVADAAP